MQKIAIFIAPILMSVSVVAFHNEILAQSTGEASSSQKGTRLLIALLPSWAP